MSILDDAIREHLELKRAHGADDSELKKLEDEAFGPPQRPDEIDPFAEAPTEFLAQPGEASEAAPAERGGRRPYIADLQEAPPTDAGPAAMPPPVTGEIDELSPTPDAPPPIPADAADVPLPPPPAEAPAADLAPPTGETPAPDSDEPTSGFFDQFSAPAADAPAPPSDAASAWNAPAPPSDEASLPATDAPATDETPLPTDEAALPIDAPAAPISEEAPLPTDESPVPTDASAAPSEEAPLPVDEAPVADAGPETEERHAIADQPTQMFDVQAHVDAEAAAEVPEGTAPEGYEQQPLDIRGPDAEVAGHPPAEADEEGSAEFDFFNEQRLSDELDQALEAPLPTTEEHLAMPRYQDAPADQGGVFDFQGGEERGGTYEEDPSQEVLRRADEAEAAEEPSPDDEDDRDYDPETGHEDVLEDTPRFLEDQGDDDLWFEQKPPKDFDLD
jgi:hypothetical protein